MKKDDTNMVVVRLNRKWLIKLFVWAFFALTACVRAYFYTRAGGAPVTAWDETWHLLWVTFCFTVALHLIEENA